MIGIVDYRMGNLASVMNALEKAGEKAIIESDPDKLQTYDRIILPGVGAFADAMEHLKQRGMDQAVCEYAQSGKNLLGICLGMQLLFDSSEEFGLTQGLGLIPGKVIAFDTARFQPPSKSHIWVGIGCLLKNIPSLRVWMKPITSISSTRFMQCVTMMQTVLERVFMVIGLPAQWDVKM